MIIPNVIPYFTKDGTIKNYEHLSTDHLRKYVLLAQDTDYPHRPDAMGIAVISLPLDTLEDVSGITWQNIEEMSLDERVQSALVNQLSVASFMRKMKQLIGERK